MATATVAVAGITALGTIANTLLGWHQKTESKAIKTLVNGNQQRLVDRNTFLVDELEKKSAEIARLNRLIDPKGLSDRRQIQQGNIPHSDR